MVSEWAGPWVTRVYRPYWEARIADAWLRARPLWCHRCPQIGRPPHTLIPGEPFHVDHIVAVSEGGPIWDLSNQAPSCQPSNQAHGAMLTNNRRTINPERTRPWLTHPAASPHS